jgi:hypothetical protein
LHAFRQGLGAICRRLGPQLGPPFHQGVSSVKEYLTNAGKKEQRQINELLTKDAREGRPHEGKEVEARTVPKQHNLKKRKGK